MYTYADAVSIIDTTIVWTVRIPGRMTPQEKDRLRRMVEKAKTTHLAGVVSVQLNAGNLNVKCHPRSRDDNMHELHDELVTFIEQAIARIWRSSNPEPAPK